MSNEKTPSPTGDDPSPQFTQISYTRSAPIPQASELDYYERVLSGSANRIITMAESEQRHSFSMERWDTIGYWSLRMVSYLGVFVLVGAMIYGSYLLFESGSITGGIASAMAAVATVLTSIIKGANKRTD